MATPTRPTKKVRYAVVGLGHFAQVAVLPAFRGAQQNSELVALVSGDPAKQRALGKRYGVRAVHSYEQYGELLQAGEIDAVYITLPNHMHRDFAVRASEASVHVLCEKPLAINAQECREMIEAAERNRTRLMTAYRLHFERGNLDVISLVKKGKIGEPKFFSSLFGHQVRPGNIRTREETGGGALYDLGVYCINAARYIFRSEPTRVFAVTSNTDPSRFHGVDESATAILCFPQDRVAQFTISQGSADVSQYRVLGTKGDIQVEPAYEYAQGIQYAVTVNGKIQKFKAPKRDQVAAEILYFSDCVLTGRSPEPSGHEGLADIRVVDAIYRSAASGQPVDIEPVSKDARPDLSQEIRRPAHGKPDLVHVAPPSQGS